MKKYQEGGAIDYNLFGEGSTFYGENPHLEGTSLGYLIDQIETLGFNINPFGDIGAQLGSITGEDFSKAVRSTYNIGKGVDVNPNMFSGFNPTQLKTLDESFYNPMIEESRGDATTAYLANLNQINKGGRTAIEASGARERKKAMAKDIYSKTMDKTFLNIVRVSH